MPHIQSPLMIYNPAIPCLLKQEHRLKYRPAIQDLKTFIQYIIDRLCAVCDWKPTSFGYSWVEFSHEYCKVSLHQGGVVLFRFTVEFEPEDSSWFISIDETEIENAATECLFVTVIFNIAEADAKTMEELDKLAAAG